MINDGRAISDNETVNCDILIIGAGPAGITLAVELEKTGRRIVLLESGGREFDASAQALNDGTVTGLDRTDLTAGRLRLLGGTSNHWGGHCLPLDPIDFARAPLSGLTGWPLTWESMADYYIRASAYCDIGNFEYALGEVEKISASGLLLPESPEILTKVIRQSRPTNFGEKYADYFAASDNVHLWLWTTAISMDIDEEGLVTNVTTRGINGAAGRFRAKDVVLACGAVENARLLLANNARLGTSFGNAGNFLGACYMDHIVGGAAFLHFDNPVTRKANWADNLRMRDGVPAHLVWRLSDKILEQKRLNNTQFFLIPYSADNAARIRKQEAERGFNELKSMVKWVLGRDQRNFRLSDSYCSVIMNADAMAVHGYQQLTGGERVDRLLLRYEAEELPTRDSYVSLDHATDALGLPKPKLHWSPGIADRDSVVNSAITIGRIVGAEGLGRIELEDHFDTRYWDAGSAWHQMGTTRMSVAPSDGVVDPDCRLHGTKNLYVIGGSVFPSGGRANPTMTIVALAVRLGEHFNSKYEA